MYCTVLYMDPGKAETEAATGTQEGAQEEEEGVWERFSSDKRELREEYSTPRILGQVTIVTSIARITRLARITRITRITRMITMITRIAD